MRAVSALLAVAGLAVLGWLGAGAPWAAGVLLPGLALLVFVLGFVYKVVVWGRAPVPFNITSVAGQQDSLPWIRHSALDSPRNGREVLLRLFLDVVLFRSLFRNTRVRRGAGQWPMYVSERLLWAASLLFHYSLLIVLLRHLRYFFDPPPALLPWIEHWDGFFQITTPTLFIHLALVSVLLVYFPFSKLMHMGGIFLSPTKTLANDNRRRRHVNPWNPTVDVHTYAQWEAEFSDKLLAAGYTLDAQPDGADVPSERA
jgi:nitrate reductase gamma subunit